MGGGPFDHGSEAQEISEVNVVPLADVSLVLLIILLTLSPMMAQNVMRIQTAGRDADSPPETPLDAALPEPAKPPELVLAVSLTRHGIAVGSQVFAGPGEFMAYMRGELARRADKKVFVAPHPDVEHGKVVHMLEMLKDCGASTAALVQTQDADVVPAPEGGPGRRPPGRGWIGDL